MLPCLARWKFVDREWGPDALEHVAEFWLRLCGTVKGPEELRSPHQTVELRLSGFPRSAAPLVSAEIGRCLFEAGFPSEVEAPDPDTVVAVIAPGSTKRGPFAGLGVGALAGGPFFGLVIEIRYTVAEAGADRPRRGLFGATLVVVGELRDGIVVVKGIGSSSPFRRRGWPEQTLVDQQLLTDFDRFRVRGRVSANLAEELFVPLPQPSRLLRAILRFEARLIDVPFDGRPRLGRLLLRAGIFASLVVAGGMFWLAIPDPPVRLILLALGAPVGWLGGRFCFLEHNRLFFGYHQLQEQYRAGRPRRERYERFSPAPGHPWLDDPHVRKYTADLEAAGFRHAGDAVTVPADRAAGFHRVFHAPDGRTCLALAFRFAGETEAGPYGVWPAGVGLLCQTFDAEGRWFETSPDEPFLSAWGRTPPNARYLVAAAAEHPLDVYRAHVPAAAEWLKETGATTLPHEPLEQNIERQEEINREERKTYRDNPYSWRDLLRVYLQRNVRPSDDSK